MTDGRAVTEKFDGMCYYYYCAITRTGKHIPPEYKSETDFDDVNARTLQCY